LINQDGVLNVVRVGAPQYLLRDLYLLLLSASWPRLLMLFGGSYVVGNLVFAALYLINGPNIDNARPGSFADAFFFSVQTMATIGYGKMVPTTLWGNILVTVESFVGLLGVAMATGLIFAKFSRPTARVVFSRRAIIGQRDGVPSLMFRVANQRGNQIVEAQLHVVLARTEMTVEGESLRRLYDLPLVRGTNALFALTWTAVHPIIPTSPLYGATPESLLESDAELVVSLTGLDESFSQTIHSRFSYSAIEIVWNARFADILSQRPDGRRQVDYRLFHDVEPDWSRPSGS
jgi:inward rectifier potassium channel